MADAPKRRWFRFSLRTLLIVVTLAGTLLGYFKQRADMQRRAVEMLERNGFRVFYDDDLTTASPFVGSITKPTKTPWLRRVFGDDYFRSLVRVEIVETPSATQIAEIDWRLFGTITSVEILNLQALPIEDEQFRHLRGLTNLKELRVLNSELTDASFQTIAGFPRLNTLIFHTRRQKLVTDVGLESIKHLGSIRTLNVLGSQITNDGLAHLQGLKSLKLIGLASLGITNAGLEHFQSLPALTDLQLEGTRVTEHGLGALAKSPSIQYVRFNGRVYDAQTLANLRQGIADNGMPGSSLTRTSTNAQSQILAGRKP